MSVCFFRPLYISIFLSLEDRRTKSCYCNIALISLRTHNSSLEGATELKFVPKCSSSDALSHGIISGQSLNFHFQAENHGL